MAFRYTFCVMAESHTHAEPETGRLLTPADVANLWAVSLRTVQRYIADGRLKAVRLPGGSYRIRPEDAAAAIAEAS